MILIAAALPLAGRAQLGSGNWELYSAFSDVTELIETGNKVYYLSAGCLYSYDKVNDESYTYTTDNVLNDNGISKIKYNREGNYLAVVYSNANIDLIYDDGTVVNMSDIKDAVMTTTPAINDIDFSKGQLIAATNFGLVLFDDVRHEVIESGFYDGGVSLVTMNDDYIFLFHKKPSWQWRRIAKSKHIYDLDKFDVLTGGATAVSFEAIADDKLLAIVDSSGKQVRIYTVLDNNSLSNSGNLFTLKGNGEYSDGYYFFNDTSIFCVSDDGETSTIALPSDFKDEKVSLWNGTDKIWVGSKNGIGQYDISGSTVTVLHDRFIPESLTTSAVGKLYALNSGGILAWEPCRSKFFGPFIDKNVETSVNQVLNGNISEVTPEGLPVPRTDVYSILQSPNDPDKFYYTTYFDGLFIVKDGKVEKQLYLQSPIAEGGLDLDIDGKGNIFMAQAYPLKSTTYTDTYRVLMLPKEKESAADDPSSWVGVMARDYLPHKTSFYDTWLVACKKSNMVLFTSWWFQGFTIVDTKGTASTADDETVSFTSFTDQDGKTVDWDGFAYLCLTEDNNGNIWIGSPRGVVMVSNLNAGINNLKFTRVKVPRNDGTNYADYLLEGEVITAIAVDSSNRKWMSTQGNGVYLVSADGSQIIEHYTSENSSLPDNTVYDVKCDKVSNAVYFGTTSGLVKYNSNASPAAPDYSEVYAYPNPVRPEYTGWIVVKNLMDGSLVKIADAAGNVFYSGRSEGGMITWDGCDANGQRVKTGVYYVFASQSSDGASSGAVTKILVVK